MFMSFISHLLSAWFAFLLPCFATFKALSRLPHSEPELQRWSMYWCIIGAFVAFEYLAEWFISWLPFYWECKTLFLLFLSLPQTQGSTYIYINYLKPFLSHNEAALDSGIVEIQRNTFYFLQEKLSTVFGAITRSLHLGTTTQYSGDPATPDVSWQAAVGFWQTYGSSVVDVLRPSGGATAARVSADTAGRRSPYVSASQSNLSTPFNINSSVEDIPTRPPSFPVPQHS